MRKARDAFTLIEVMVAVLIISVVIAALFEMQGNNSHFFSKFYEKMEANQVVSFFISNKEYGFDKKSIYLDDLLSDFKVDDELRRKLKEVKVELEYEELDSIDMSEEQDEDETQEVESYEDEDSEPTIALEIGKTIIKFNDSSASTIRLKIQ